MRFALLYGIIFFCSVVIINIQADRKWKYDSDKIDKKSQNLKEKISYGNKFSKRSIKKNEENQTGPSTKIEERPQKRFIGRIEHGKVKVLRRKDDSGQTKNAAVTSEEDYKENVCRKGKGNNVNCNENAYKETDSSLSEESAKSKKKIKYSIKFKHEKQKKNDFNGDNTILRLHKNDRKYGKQDDDSDSSEEDDNLIKKPFHFMDDDED